MEQIKAEVSGLNAAIISGSHMSVINMLREFVSKIFVVSNDGLNFKKFFKQLDVTSAICLEELHVIYNLLILKEIGSLCAGIANFLCRIYKLFGYASAVLDFGIKDTKRTHVITLVRFPNDGKLYIQDATFNLTYMTDRFEYCDFLSLLKLIRTDAYSKIIIKRGSNTKLQRCGLEASENDTEIITSSLTKTKLYCKLQDEYLSFKHYFDINHLNTKDILARLLNKDIDKVNFLDLMLVPLILTDLDLLSNSFELQSLFHELYLKNVYIPHVNVKSKVACYGISKRFFETLPLIVNEFEIVALIDGDEKKWGKKILDLEILPPNQIKNLETDKIIISSSCVDEIYSSIHRYNQNTQVYFFVYELLRFRPLF